MGFQWEHLLDSIVTIAVSVLAIAPVWAIGRAFRNRKSAEASYRMPPFGGGGAGGWTEWERKRRSGPGKPAGTRPSFGGSDQLPERTEPKPFGGGNQAPARSVTKAEEAHYEGYERSADWEARMQRYEQQDRAHREIERRQADEERAHLDQLRQGIIWSEILGLPRAKRPYGK